MYKLSVNLTLICFVRDYYIFLEILKELHSSISDKIYELCINYL
jgi:hypothetical protein